MATYSEIRYQNRRKLRIALGITGAFFLIEVVGGILTNSLALLSDAGHMLTDILALGMSLLAMWFAQRPPTQRHSFGFHRLEIFAAFLNGLTLTGISVYIFIEAFRRFQAPPEVAGLPMLLIAATGFVVNLVIGVILHKSKDHSLNVKGAYLHVLGDALGSVGAVAAGIIMWTTGWMYADPLFSVIIGIIIIFSSIRLLRDTFHVLMQGTPADISPEEVRNAITSLAYVINAHDLHIWTLTTGIEAMTIHVNVDENIPKGYHDTLINRIRELVRDQFNIQHSTIQVEMMERQEECCLVRNERV